MAIFANNASGAMLLLNLIQVRESISGSVVPLCNVLICVFFALVKKLRKDVRPKKGEKVSCMDPICFYFLQKGGKAVNVTKSDFEHKNRGQRSSIQRTFIVSFCLP